METNGLKDGASYHYGRKVVGKVEWTRPGLKITRLRLLSDPGFPAWDVSYCHGILNGEDVDVELPFDQLQKGKSINAQIVAWAKRDGLYAAGTGVFSAISTLN